MSDQIRDYNEYQKDRDKAFYAYRSRESHHPIPHIVVGGVEMKSCSKCASLKPATLDHYYSAKNRIDGLSSYCVDCTSIYRKELKKKVKV